MFLLQIKAREGSRGFSDVPLAVSAVAEGFPDVPLEVSAVAEGFPMCRWRFPRSRKASRCAVGGFRGRGRLPDVPMAVSAVAEGFSDVPLAVSAVAEGFSDVPLAVSAVAEGFSDVPLELIGVDVDMLMDCMVAFGISCMVGMYCFIW